MKEPLLPSAPKDGKFTCPDLSFLSLYPHLADALCNPFYENGKPRKLSKLKVSFTDVGVAVLIDEPSKDLYAFTNGTELVEVLMLLDEALRLGTLAWRKSTYTKRPSR